MAYKKKELKSKTISCRVKPSTYQKLEELMDCLLIESTSDFIDFVVNRLRIKNKKLLKEYHQKVKQLEEQKMLLKAKLEIDFVDKLKLEKDEPPC